MDGEIEVICRCNSRTPKNKDDNILTTACSINMIFRHKSEEPSIYYIDFQVLKRNIEGFWRSVNGSDIDRLTSTYGPLPLP